MIAEVWKKGSLLLSVFLCSGLLVQAGQLEVKCVDQSGSPISGVKVRSLALGKQKGKDEKSNKQGVAQFKKLDDGYYRVYAHQKGYAPAMTEFVEVKGDQQKSVTLTFEPGNQDEPLYFEDRDKLAAAQQALQAGGAALQNQQFSEAETQLKAAVEDNPAEPVAHSTLATVYLQEQKWDLAETELKEAAKLLQMYQVVMGDSNPAIGQQLENVQTQLKFVPVRKLAYEIDVATKAKDFEKALGYLGELVKLRPDDARVYYTMSYMLAQTKQIDEAVEKIDKAIELKPDEQDFQNLKKQLVTIQANQAARAKANEARAKVAEVQELNKDGKSQEAITRAEAVLPEVPKELQSALWAEITNAHIRLGQYPQAVDAYTNVLELDQKPVAPGLYKLGEQFVRKGQQEPASAVFEKVLELDPNYAEAYYQLGMYYFYEKQDKAKAKELLEKYLTLGKDKDNLDNAKNVLVVMEKS